MSEFKTMNLNAVKAEIEGIDRALSRFNALVLQSATVLAENDELDLAERLLQIGEKGTHLLADVRNIENRYDWRWKYGLGVKNVE